MADQAGVTRMWLGEGRDLIRTLIAEHTALVRAGLVAFLNAEDDIEVIAELHRGDDVVRVSRALLPDVAVVDAELPGLDGFNAAAALRVALPSCHCLIISAQRRPSDLRLAAAAHASGFVVRDAAQDFITYAIRRVSKGFKVIDPELAFAAINAERNPLTERELDALRFAAQGASTAEIARRLSLSVGTVRNYLSRAITKTGARNRVDLIRISDSSGWL